MRKGSRSASSWNDPELTEQAERVYLRLARAAAECIENDDLTNAKVTTFNMVDEAITKLIPQDPTNPRYALSGPLSNVFRIKKGRMRICYLTSSHQKRIVILYISETIRKSGDASDPYNLFTKLVMSGKYDNIFTSLGVKTPNR